MKVLIKPTIIICEPVMNKNFGYKAILDKKAPYQLTIKAKSSDGRGRGVAGRITREGEFELLESHPKLRSALTPVIKERINLTLDLVFGIKRNKQGVLNERGQVEFKNS